jgi:flagellar motor switch protein FliM
MSLNDLLTPEEVDALLKEVDRGGIAGDGDDAEADREVVPYDFSAQEHIVRSAMPTLEMIYEKFSRQLRTTLTGVLRRATSVELVRVQSQRYVEWFSGLPPHCGMHLYKVRPLHGTALFVLPPQLVDLMVDSYFGGRLAEAGSEEPVVRRREITSSELRITRIILERIARELEAAWAPVHPIALDSAGVETNPLFATIASPPDRMIVGRFAIRLGGASAELSFVIPYAMIEPIRDLLDNGMLSEHSDVDRRWRESLIRSLQDVCLELRGILVETVVPVRRVLAMKPGDVIPIDLPKQLPLLLEQSPAFRGALGSARGRNAVKITQVLRHDPEPLSRPGLPDGPPEQAAAGAAASVLHAKGGGFAARA